MIYAPGRVAGENIWKYDRSRNKNALKIAPHFAVVKTTKRSPPTCSTNCRVRPLHTCQSVRAWPFRFRVATTHKWGREAEKNCPSSPAHDAIGKIFSSSRAEEISAHERSKWTPTLENTKERRWCIELFTWAHFYIRHGQHMKCTRLTGVVRIPLSLTVRLEIIASMCDRTTMPVCAHTPGGAN